MPDWLDEPLRPGSHELKLPESEKRPVCDFCSDPDELVKYRVKVKSFTKIVGDVDWKSVGDWAACDSCFTMIRAKDVNGLVERSYASNRAYDLKHGITNGWLAFPIGVAKRELRRTFITFQEMSTGEFDEVDGSKR